MPKKTVAETFDEHWEEQLGPLKTPCHVWKRGRFQSGYGALKINGKTIKAHRFSFQRERKALLTSTQLVLHLCDNPPCVNRSHLYLGTFSDNAKDRYLRGRHDQRGSRNPCATLTETDVVNLREDRSRGFTLKELGRRYKTSPQNASKILQGKRWSHV